MKKIGGYIALVGVLTIILPFLNLQVRFLGWIDNWGDTTSWGIKIGLVVVGATLFLKGGSKTESQETPEAVEEQKPE